MFQNTSNRICANHGKEMLFGKKGKVNGVKSIVYEKDGNTYAYTDLLYNNKMITTVSLFEYAEGQKTEDFIVDMISYSYLDDESVSEIIKVDDISGKNKKEDVLSKFGEPTNRETLDTGSEIITYETNNNDNSYVEFWFTKDNIISTIMIKNI